MKLSFTSVHRKLLGVSHQILSSCPLGTALFGFPCLSCSWRVGMVVLPSELVPEVPFTSECINHLTFFFNYHFAANALYYNHAQPWNDISFYFIVQNVILHALIWIWCGLYAFTHAFQEQHFERASYSWHWNDRSHTSSWNHPIQQDLLSRTCSWTTWCLHDVHQSCATGE